VKNRKVHWNETSKEIHGRPSKKHEQLKERKKASVKLQKIGERAMRNLKSRKKVLARPQGRLRLDGITPLGV